MMRVFAVRFSPQDQSIFVSGGWDDTVQVKSCWPEKNSNQTEVNCDSQVFRISSIIADLSMKKQSLDYRTPFLRDSEITSQPFNSED